MIQKICNGLHFSNVYVTEIWGSRKQSSTELAELFRENGCKQVYAEPDCEKAFELAYAKKGDGLLFVVGSLYLVGEIKDYLKRRNKLINYEEELKKFEPCQDVDDAENAIYRQDLTECCGYTQRNFKRN